MKTRPPRLAIAIVLGLSAAAALAADVEIKDAWVRGTVTGQQATGAFMEITSRSGGVLVGATSPAAEITEIHEMKMEGGVMKMRAVGRLELPAGKPVTLGPGGYHVMLIKLRQPLKKGDAVPLTLAVEGRDKKVEAVSLKAEVRDLAAPPAGEHRH